MLAPPIDVRLPVRERQLQPRDCGPEEGVGKLLRIDPFTAGNRQAPVDEHRGMDALRMLRGDSGDDVRAE